VYNHFLCSFSSNFFFCNIMAAHCFLSNYYFEGLLAPSIEMRCFKSALTLVIPYHIGLLCTVLKLAIIIHSVVIIDQKLLCGLKNWIQLFWAQRPAGFSFMFHCLYTIIFTFVCSPSIFSVCCYFIYILMWTKVYSNLSCSSPMHMLTS